MADTKEYFDQIMENQNKLLATLNEFANEAVEMMMPNDKFAERTNELLKEYLTKPYEFVEELAQKDHIDSYQKDFWGSYSADINRSMELSMELYRKTADFFRDIWTRSFYGDQQARMKRYSDIIQKCMKTYMETTNANTKIVQEYFSKN